VRGLIVFARRFHRWLRMIPPLRGYSCGREAVLASFGLIRFAEHFSVSE
jgi:hypothetical protein